MDILAAGHGVHVAAIVEGLGSVLTALALFIGYQQLREQRYEFFHQRLGSIPIDARWAIDQVRNLATSYGHTLTTEEGKAEYPTPNKWHEIIQGLRLAGCIRSSEGLQKIHDTAAAFGSAVVLAREAAREVHDNRPPGPGVPESADYVEAKGNLKMFRTGAMEKQKELLALTSSVPGLLDEEIQTLAPPPSARSRKLVGWLLGQPGQSEIKASVWPQRRPKSDANPEL